MERIIRVENVDFSYNKPQSFIKDMSFDTVVLPLPFAPKIHA